MCAPVSSSWRRLLTRVLEKGKRNEIPPPFHQQQHEHKRKHASAGGLGVSRAKKSPLKCGGRGLDTGLDEDGASEDDDPDE
jgi:hypothetical protein